MEALVIDGGRPLYGKLDISGAKNAALPILAATVICGGVYELGHCPEIDDVELAMEIICALGGWAERRGKTLLVDTTRVCSWQIPKELMERMRASVLFLGALLARFGKAEIWAPGGCPLGGRPIDLHLSALSKMGVQISCCEGKICCEAPKLHGCCVQLGFPSVGATENILLAAMGCREAVEIHGAAREPEIGDLIGFLQTMGAEITGKDTGTLRICGGRVLSPCTYSVMPDRMEAATYLCTVAGCGGKVTLQNVNGMLLFPVLQALEQAGCDIDLQEREIILSAPERLRAVSSIQTAPYPGFPTDAQAPMMAALLRAEGVSTIREGVFAQRFFHVPQMRRLGAELEVCGPCVRIRGVSRLEGAALWGSDLRASAALTAAALQATGKSVVYGINHLKRGYDDWEGNLRKLGAQIFCQDISQPQ